MIVGALATAAWLSPLSVAPPRWHQARVQSSIVLQFYPRQGDEQRPESGGGPNFYAAYDDADLQALWDVHSQFFGDIITEEAPEPEPVNEGSVLGGLHQAVLSAIAESEADADTASDDPPPSATP